MVIRRPDEDAINPEWRRQLYAMAEELSANSLPHLQRDWPKEAETYRVFRERLRAANEIEEVLKAEPASWDNLMKRQKNTDGNE